LNQVCDATGVAAIVAPCERVVGVATLTPP
jgi:hypothetical protein